MTWGAPCYPHVETNRCPAYEFGTMRHAGSMSSRFDDTATGGVAVANLSCGRRGDFQQRHRPSVGHLSPNGFAVA